MAQAILERHTGNDVSRIEIEIEKYHYGDGFLEIDMGERTLIIPEQRVVLFDVRGEI